MDYNTIRRPTRAVRVGALTVGGTAPLTVQSMTNTDPHDIGTTCAQVRRLAAAGCDIVRLTVPDEAAAEVIRAIKGQGVTVPLVADIHFDYKAALAAVRAGADKIRINPGNIGGQDRVRAVAEACGERGIPIRIGVNSGSLERSILQKYGAPTGEALAESALYHASLLEDCGFYDIVLSVKASDVPAMLAANRLLAARTNYPLHLGVTEAGARTRALVKSSVGIGALLSEGIGDTLRVSLTEDPEHEVTAAREILRALELTADRGLDIVSCPTCGRTGIALISMVEEFERAAAERGLDRLPLKVALMGCVVNGPGEARCADIGIAGGHGEGLLFRRGETVRKLPERELVSALLTELEYYRDHGDFR